MCHTEASNHTIPSEVPFGGFVVCQLNWIEFHFLKFPLLYGSGLGLAKSEVCIPFRRGKCRSKVSVSRQVPLQLARTVANLLPHLAGAGPHLALQPSSSTRSPPTVPPSPKPGAHAAM